MKITIDRNGDEVRKGPGNSPGPPPLACSGSCTASVPLVVQLPFHERARLCGLFIAFMLKV